MTQPWYSLETDEVLSALKAAERGFPSPRPAGGSERTARIS
jgi:hypothetical protein